MTRSLIIRVDEVLKWSTGTCIHVAWPWPPPTLHSTVKRSDQFARAFITECWRARFAEYFRMSVHHQRNANTLIVSSMEQFSHTDKLEVRRICVICIVRTTSLQIPYFIISKTCIIASTTDLNYPFSFILISIFVVMAAHTHTHTHDSCSFCYCCVCIVSPPISPQWMRRAREHFIHLSVGVMVAFLRNRFMRNTTCQKLEIRTLN